MSEKKYAQYLKDKTVALIGPASYYDEPEALLVDDVLRGILGV